MIKALIIDLIIFALLAYGVAIFLHYKAMEGGDHKHEA